ncbi:MAG: phosphotransferase, partial [Gammaproteobacteria bacterium]|nr:phosphotransferase [Gammaproteobacteria bacterium]
LARPLARARPGGPGAGGAGAAPPRHAGWLGAEDKVLSAAPAGEGNMNRTLRLETSGRSIVLKQSVPFVAKYPEIPAPHARDRVEAAFYREVGGCPELAGAMPAFLGHVPEHHLLAFEDLGTAADFTSAYRDGDLAGLEALGGWLAVLHARTSADPVFENADMRALNHAHIFEIPFVADSGLDLEGITPGLAALQRLVSEDESVMNRARELGAAYLGARTGALLHGDFYPGSWLRHADGPKVIDPEFAFVGPPEFDAGVLLAHLVLTGHAPRLPESYVPLPRFDTAAANGFAGIEVLRRLLGVAQLPLDADIRMKGRWIDQAVELVTG